MLKLAQLKYPGFPVKVTGAQATVSPLVSLNLCRELTMQFMTWETSYFASDYESELRDMGTPAGLAAATTVVQFPYTAQVSWSSLSNSH